MIVLSMTLSATSPAPELAIGERLPLLQGEYLNGQRANLPQDSSGRAALLMLGFTYESRFAVEAFRYVIRLQPVGVEPLLQCVGASGVAEAVAEPDAAQ